MSAHFACTQVWLHNREDLVLPITVELSLRPQTSRTSVSRFTDALDCSQYAVRLSFRTDPFPYGDGAGGAGTWDGKLHREAPPGGWGGEINMSTCSAIELEGEGQTGQAPDSGADMGGVRQALVFSVPAPNFLS